MKKKKTNEIKKIVIKRNTSKAPFYLVTLDEKPISIDGYEYDSSGSPNFCKLSLAEVEEIEILGVFHLIPMPERLELIKWAYKTLKKDGMVRIESPHWSHSKAYMDPGVCWPPLTADFFFLTKEDHRKQLAPHVPLDVDFDYSVSGAYDKNDAYVALRNVETKGVFMHRNINTTTDIIAVLKKR
jgi:hypothetical protein